jgi:predicted amidohydrolase YtcJ
MPMAPAKPMQLIWAAVNRNTAEGPVAGPQHKVSLDVALKAMTIDAAYSIQMEKKVGSIEVGKDANLTVLDQSPYAVAPGKLKDIKVWGTMLEGRVQPVNRKMPKAAINSAVAPKSDSPLAAASRDDTELAFATTASLTRLLEQKHNH